MANIDANIEAETTDDIKSKAKEKINNNRRSVGIGAGLGAAAALFTTGYLIGHKHGESQNFIDRLMKQIRD